MPVDFDSDHPTELPDENTNGRYILEFLADDPDLGYRAGELAKELDIPRGSVGTTLSRLETRGLVRHKGEYWAINPEAYDAHMASLIGLEAVAIQFEGDYYDENLDWDDDLPDLNEEEKRPAVAIVGSSNFSQGGQRNNVEQALLKPTPVIGF